MTTLAISHLIHETPAAVQRLLGRLRDYAAGISAARAMAEQYRALSHLSDAELARLGLKREDIPRAVLAAGTRS